MNKQETIELLTSKEGREQIKKHQNKVLKKVGVVWSDNPTTALSKLIYENTRHDCTDKELVCDLENYHNEQNGITLRSYPISMESQLEIQRIVHKKEMSKKDDLITFLSFFSFFLFVGLVFFVFVA